MSAKTATESNIVADRYRCDEKFGAFDISPEVYKLQPGYFRLGADTICYGRTAVGSPRPTPKHDLDDVLRSVPRQADNVPLPFDPHEIIENLRFERYTQCTKEPGRTVGTTFAGRAYYLFRPLMPVPVRRRLQKLYLKGWNRIPFPSWPVDRTVENIFEQLIKLRLESAGVQRMPFIWFWPKGHSACVMMTHDVETEAGRDFSTQLADLDSSFGIKSAFQLVPEERYSIPAGFIDSLRAHGCEINVHGLNHGPHLFRDREEFLRQAERINYYAQQFGAMGFRSPGMYRNVDWFDDLQFSYDMSVPASAHLEPQRGGCCTVMPYFIGKMVELPLTTTQDYTIFYILGERSIALWKREMDLIMGSHGLASFNTHPDYLLSPASLQVYRQLLGYLTEIGAERRVWFALPGEVNEWWRKRHEMRLAPDHNGFKVTGEGSEQAIVAYASLNDGRVVYEFSSGRALHAA
jgi:hypothetical protein